MHGDPVAVRYGEDRLLLTGGEHRMRERGRDPHRVVKVELLDRRNGSVEAHEVGLEPDDVTVLARAFDGYGTDQDQVVAGRHVQGSVRERHATATRGPDAVERPLPAA